MTELETTLETILEDLTDEALAIDTDGLEPDVLRGWKDMCIGALYSLGKLSSRNHSFPIARIDDGFDSLIEGAADWLNDAMGGFLSADEYGLFVDQCCAFIAMAHASHKRELKNRAKERLETVTVAQQNGVTPIGIAIEGAQKGQLVFVKTGTCELLENAVIQSPCPPHCKFAKWHTDGKPSTEPGYGARCDVCKLDKKRPGFESESTWSPGEPLIIASHFIDPNMNWRTIEPKQSGCCGGCNCQKERLYK